MESRARRGLADLVANPAWTVELTGHASAEGQAENNFELARDRIITVVDELGGYGIDQGRMLRDNQGEDGAAANDPLERCVDVFVVDVDNQVTSAHETGHMFGLADEYLTGTDVAGDPLDADYQQLIRDNVELSGGMPTKDNVDSIMSNGMTVETWHYAPFVALLKQITGTDQWTV